MTVHDGPTVTLTGADCLALEHYLGRELAKARGRLDRSSRAYEALAGLSTVAQLHVAELAEFRRNGTSSDSSSEPGRRWTSQEVADRLQISPRAVIAAVATGRLTATRTGHRWQFDPGAVADWAERRNRR